MSNDFDVLSVALAKANIRDEVADTQFESSVSQQMAACGEALVGNFTLDFVGAVGRGLGAAFTCSNAFAQIGFSGTLDNLTQMDSQLDRRQSITEFRQRFADRALAFQGFAEDLGTQIEEIDARLADIEKESTGSSASLGARAIQSLGCGFGRRRSHGC